MIKDKMQEMYNRVKHHLLTQNQKSVNGGNGCYYRSDSGLKCAIGALIPDKDYKKIMDDSGDVSTNYYVRKVLIDEFGLLNSTPDDRHEFMVLARKLQGVHDTVRCENWHIQLATAANDYKLNDTPMEELNKIYATT